MASSKAPDATTSTRDDGDPDLQTVIPVCALGETGGARLGVLFTCLTMNIIHRGSAKAKGRQCPMNV
jgi:hypothetical protein